MSAHTTKHLLILLMTPALGVASITMDGLRWVSVKTWDMLSWGSHLAHVSGCDEAGRDAQTSL